MSWGFVRSRIATGFFNFCKDVAHGWQAKVAFDEILGAQPLEGAGIAHDRPDVAATGGDDAAGDAIGFGMDGRGIERFGPVANAQEACALLKSLGAKPRDLQKRLAGRESAMDVAMGDNGLGN